MCHGQGKIPGWTILSSRMGYCSNNNLTCCRYCYLGRALTAQLRKKSAWLLHLIGDKASPAAYDSSKASRELNQHLYPHAGNGGHSWRLSCSLSLTVRLFIQGEAIYGPAFPRVGTTVLSLCSHNLVFFTLFAQSSPAIVVIAIVRRNSFSCAFPISRGLTRRIFDQTI